MGTPYIGFAGKTYLDEIIFLEKHSESPIFIDKFEVFLQNSLKLIVEGAVSTSPLGAFLVTAIELFPASSTVPTSEIEYTAFLFEDKYVKICYINEDGAYLKGSHTERTECEVIHEIVTVNGLITSPTLSNIAKTTNNYNSADALAFNNYIMGGFIERITNYRYEILDYNNNIIEVVHYDSIFAW